MEKEFAGLTSCRVDRLIVLNQDLAESGVKLNKCGLSRRGILLLIEYSLVVNFGLHNFQCFHAIDLFVQLFAKFLEIFGCQLIQNKLNVLFLFFHHIVRHLLHLRNKRILTYGVLLLRRSGATCPGNLTHREPSR